MAGALVVGAGVDEGAALVVVGAGAVISAALLDEVVVDEAVLVLGEACAEPEPLPLLEQPVEAAASIVSTADPTANCATRPDFPRGMPVPCPVTVTSTAHWSGQSTTVDLRPSTVKSLKLTRVLPTAETAETAARFPARPLLSVFVLSVLAQRPQSASNVVPRRRRTANPMPYSPASTAALAAPTAISVPPPFAAFAGPRLKPPSRCWSAYAVPGTLSA